MNRGQAAHFKNDDFYKTTQKIFGVLCHRYKDIWIEPVINSKLITVKTPVEHEISIKALDDEIENFTKIASDAGGLKYVYFVYTIKEMRFMKSCGRKGNKFYIHIKSKDLHVFSYEIDVFNFVPEFETVEETEDFVESLDLVIINDGKYFRFQGKGDWSLTGSLNFFVQNYNDCMTFRSDGFSLNATVKYVGKTKNPRKRPLKLNHEGLSRAIYNRKEFEDVYVRIHSMYSVVLGKNGTFALPGSSLDIFKADKEAEIFEKLFILYFQPEEQKNNLKYEARFLQNSFQILNGSNFKYILVDYDTTRDEPMFYLESESIVSKRNHRFIYGNEDDSNKMFISDDSDYLNDVLYRWSNSVPTEIKDQIGRMDSDSETPLLKNGYIRKEKDK